MNGMGLFLLTRPLRDVTDLSSEESGRMLFLLTRPLRDVTAYVHGPKPCKQFLLTRPLRDVTNGKNLLQVDEQNFYSHVPCGT